MTFVVIAAVLAAVIVNEHIAQLQQQRKWYIDDVH